MVFCVWMCVDIQVYMYMCISVCVSDAKWVQFQNAIYTWKAATHVRTSFHMSGIFWSVIQCVCVSMCVCVCACVCGYGKPCSIDVNTIMQSGMRFMETT